MSVRRYLASVTPEDATPPSAFPKTRAGRPVIRGWGRRYVERLSGRAPRTVAKACNAGRLDDPLGVVVYALEQRGAVELAAAVVAALDAEG